MFLAIYISYASLRCEGVGRQNGAQLRAPERILLTLLSSVLLREITSSYSTGTSSSIIERLWVQPIVCQAMVGVLSMLILLILAMLSKHEGRSVRSISPGSIAATIVFAGHAAYSQFPNSLGAASIEKLAKYLDRSFESPGSSSLLPNSRFSFKDGIPKNRKKARIMDCATTSRNTQFLDPMSLRSVSRIALFLAVAVCSVTLAALLWKSDDQQGLGEGVGSKYRLYAWTTAPAAILTIASWWLSSIDGQVRTFAPYDSLNRKSFDISILHLNLLRGLIPSVLYWEMKTSNFAAVTTTIAALLGATLTTASAAMFHVIIYPVSIPIALSPSTVFTTTPIESIRRNSGSSSFIELWTAGRISSLILEANLSYSRQVYQDLVFPTFSTAPVQVENTSRTTNVSATTINLTSPALRPRLSCRMYSQADIAATYVRNYSFPGSPSTFALPSDGIVVSVTAEKCLYFRDLNETLTAHFITGGRSGSLFGASGFDADGRILIGGCSDLLYIWGSYNSSPGPVTNISAVACNSSVELVYATLSVLGADLSLDLSNPPKAIETTARNIPDYDSVASYTGSDLYDDLAAPATTGGPLFDIFFQQLVTSRYAVPMSAIGDPTQSQIVMNAIQFQHKLVHAQFLSKNYRIDITNPAVRDNKTNALMPSLFYNASSGEQVKFPAVMTYPFGRHRVVQDTTATAILEVLLLSILILSIMGWWLHPTKAALPRSPTSVASVLALLAGGNLLEHIYDGSPEPLCWEDLESRLGKDSRFYLGWDPSTPGQSSSERRFGIWMINERNQE